MWVELFTPSAVRAILQLPTATELRAAEAAVSTCLVLMPSGSHSSFVRDSRKWDISPHVKPTPMLILDHTSPVVEPPGASLLPASP